MYEFVQNLESFENVQLLVDIAVILFAALGFGYIAQKLKQPVILGYLFAGIVIGPFVLKIVGRIEDVHVLAEIGVSLLMFVVGLEFAPRLLRKIWKIAIFGGYMEMCFMFLLGYLLGWLFDLSTIESLFLGGIIAISSTIIIVKMLQELAELDQLHGRIMVGILIVEDVGAIVIISMLSNLSKNEGGMVFEDFIIPSMLALTFVVIMLALGKWVLPRLIKSVSRIESKELRNPVEEPEVSESLPWKAAIFFFIIAVAFMVFIMYLGRILNPTPAGPKG